MLMMRREFVAGVQAAKRREELYPSLQSATELEHSTIPPYLTALYSIKTEPDRNIQARIILSSIVQEEMLHMTIACNLLNAIGGAPKIATPGFIPLYPGPLPMHVHEALTVGLRKATRGLIYNVFMTLEEPEVPLKLTVKNIKPQPLPALADAQLAMRAAHAEGYATIGKFYAAIKEKIGELGDGIFKESNPQVLKVPGFSSQDLFAVTNVKTASDAIDIIVDQGEGTKTSPYYKPNKVAHYYRLAQIVYGRKLVPDNTEVPPYSYSGTEVPLDPAEVWNLYPDAKSVDYKPGSAARKLVDQFNYYYTSLLQTLDSSFNGHPEMITTAIKMMDDSTDPNNLRGLAQAIVQTPVDGTDFTAAPTFEYNTVKPA
jgi:Ferritin-like